jgi:hypothetical protein
MAEKVGDVVFVSGTKPDGKPRWKNIGVVFKSDKGLSIKLDAVPAGEWDGWLKIFKSEPVERPPASPPPQADPGFSDDIPF